MNFDEYQTEGARTLNTAVTQEMAFANYALGLAGESGEVVEMLKKYVFHSKPLDRDKLKDELSDVLWYLAALASTAGLTLGEIAAHNVAKLRARYAKGFVPGGGVR